MISKKLKNKISTMCATALIATAYASINAVPTFAVNNEFNNEKVAVCNYLDAIMSNDLEKAVEISDFPGFSEEEELANLKELNTNPNTKIEAYEILDDGEIQDNNYIEFRIAINYENGRKEILPIQASIEDDKAIVQLSENINYVEVIDEGVYIENPTPYVQLTKWDYNLAIDGRATGYTSPFSARSSTYVDLNYQNTCSIKFTVVENRVVGANDVSVTKTAGITSTATRLSLPVLSGKIFDNVKLKIHLNSTGGRSFGEVYAY